MDRFIVVFDASPINEPTPWMKQAASQANLFLVLQDDIARAISEDPAARKALLEIDTVGADPRMAPFYQAALDKLTQGKSRIALHSVTWLTYGLKPDAVVLSFDQMQNERARAHKLGMNDQTYDYYVEEAKKTVRAFLKGVPAERMTEVSGSDSQKATAAAAFIRSKQR
ncbi:hypothetical protein JRI60_51625 [Archangium violaceum]|jgi:hypothetical protein|uniref:hypothetical protein n=1 Tax=Archangium violaceum TaxID=83451 RepID=UPI0019516CDD|nr:hypothetical protein [Archangium violaceum]QRN97305.1 hypothetical protein JRI60_51625 [Archangium violaceum]